MHQKRLATGLRLDPVGELKRSPIPSSRRCGRFAAMVGIRRRRWPPLKVSVSASGGGWGSRSPNVFQDNFSVAKYFFPYKYFSQYIDAHFGGNRLQLSFRVLELYFLSVRSISGKTEDVYQHTDRLPTYFTRRTSTSMTHIGT